MKTSERKLKAANAMLQAFASDTTISRRWQGGWQLSWVTHNGKHYARRWQVSPGNDWYPPWHGKWPHGGTACYALAQLMRWLQKRPVVGLSSFRAMSSPSIGLYDAGSESVLAEAGWPEHAECVLCGIELRRGHDWWSLDGVSGPCCNHNRGCRQKGKPVSGGMEATS